MRCNTVTYIYFPQFNKLFEPLAVSNSVTDLVLSAADIILQLLECREVYCIVHSSRRHVRGATSFTYSHPVAVKDRVSVLKSL